MPKKHVKEAIYQAINTHDWSQRSAVFKLSQKVRCDRSSVHRILNYGIALGEIEKYPIESGFGYRLKQEPTK